MNESRFAIRTIKNGSVRIGGKVFRPQNKAYDGRLDGLRMVFGRYAQPDGYADFVALWGTERAYREGPGVDWPGPGCVNGVFIYEWWDADGRKVIV